MFVDAHRARFWLLSLLLAFVTLAPGRAAANGDFFWPSRIVVFGTSLSDPGNFYTLTEQNVSAPDYGMTCGVAPDDCLSLIARIPNAPYAQGGNRYSNGATWIEQLARELGYGPDAGPAWVESRKRAFNYAFGSARALNNKEEPFDPRDLKEQVSKFLADVGGDAPSNALYIIEMGGNDIRDALIVAQTAGPGAALAHLDAAVSALGHGIKRLHAKGARRFLIWTAPDVGLTPALKAIGASEFGTVLSGYFNANLERLLGTLTGTEISVPWVGFEELPGFKQVTFDAFGALQKVAYAPHTFGLTDATTACIEPNVPPISTSEPPFRCQHPNRHLFWDGIHPTRAGHGIIAHLVLRTFLESFIDH